MKNQPERQCLWPLKDIAITTAITLIATTHASYAQADTSLGYAAGVQDNLLLAQAGNQMQFDILSQPLDTALEAFGRQSGIQMLYSTAVVEDQTTFGVSGSYTPEQALQILLAGTGFDYRFTGPGTVTLSSTREVIGEQRLEPVVVTATRTETPVSQLTRSVSVVTGEEMRKQETVDRNLGSILANKIPGLRPSTEGLSNFGQTLRGRDFLTLIDGIPTTTSLRTTGRDLNTIDPSAIERIEVVRGGTAAYGFGATGGLINIITRRPEEDAFNGYSEAGFKISTEEVDDSLQWHTTHQVSGRTGEIDYLVGGTFVDRQGFFDADGDRIPPDPLGVQGGFADSEETNPMRGLPSIRTSFWFASQSVSGAWRPRSMCAPMIIGLTYALEW